MKKIAYGRGQGKTTRLLYASEFNDAPIVCQTYQSKNYLMEMAKLLKLNIPEPIVVSEIASGRVKGTENIYKDLLIDDAEWVLDYLLREFGMKGKVKGMSFTLEEYIIGVNKWKE